MSHYPPNAITYRVVPTSGRSHFLKLARPGAHPSLSAEAERTVWAREHLPVPTVLEHGVAPDVEWLVTEEIPGTDATAGRWSREPDRVVGALAEGLRRLHEAPVAACPFDFRLDSALELARRRVRRGLVDPDQDFHEEHAHLSVEGALAELEDTRPGAGDPVVCHGDYCPPNILLLDWAPVGYVDLGELGVADRWWDVAVASWSAGWNYGPRHEEAFLDAYGVERDEQRIAFYRLLYDLVS